VFHLIGFLRLWTTPFFGGLVVRVNIHEPIMDVAIRMVIEPMISRIVMLPPNYDEYD
jgi:hypothetical protein